MKGNQTNWKKLRWTSVIALLVAALVPFAAFAQTNQTAISAAADATAQATIPSGQGNRNTQGAPSNPSNPSRAAYNVPDAPVIDTQNLTDEQKAVYEKALTLYEQIENAVLADLVTANVVAQSDVDTYLALRDGNQALQSLDMSAWTAEQYKAYYEAIAQSGEDRQTALQALADSGQLTQAQANALGTQGKPTLWQNLIKNASTNKTIQIALNTLQQARQAMVTTLREAGIMVNARDNSFDGNRPGAGNNRPMMDDNDDEWEGNDDQESDD